MSNVIPIVVSNVTLAAVLAIVVFLVTRVWRSPQLAHALWALVPVKLITPPLVGIPVAQGWLVAKKKVEASATLSIDDSEAGRIIESSTPSISVQGRTAEEVGVPELKANADDGFSTASIASRDEEVKGAPVPVEATDRDTRPTNWERSLALLMNRLMNALGIVWLLGSAVYAVLLVR